MEKDFKREIVFDNKKIKDLVLSKLELVEKGKVLNEEALVLAKQHEDIVKKITKTAEKIREIQVKVLNQVKKKLKDLDLGEYEVPLTTDIKEDKLVLIVEDTLEVFKDKFAKHDKFGEVLQVKEAKKKK